MNDYLTYSVEDFVTDESYLGYYYREDKEDIRFWTDWISRHPEKLDVIISADNYISAFSIRLSDAEFQIERHRFDDALKECLDDDSPLYVADEENEFLGEVYKPAIVTYQKRTILKFIAAVMGLILFVCLYFLLS